MRGVKKTLSTTLLTGLCVLAVSATAVNAASECKGLAQTECEAKTECRWIDGYTRKDGKEVSGYCRSLGKKSSEAKEEASSKKSE